MAVHHALEKLSKVADVHRADNLLIAGKHVRTIYIQAMTNNTKSNIVILTEQPDNEWA